MKTFSIESADKNIMNIDTSTTHILNMFLTDILRRKVKF